MELQQPAVVQEPIVAVEAKSTIADVTQLDADAVSIALTVIDFHSSEARPFSRRFPKMAHNANFWSDPDHLLLIQRDASEAPSSTEIIARCSPTSEIGDDANESVFAELADLPDAGQGNLA